MVLKYVIVYCVIDMDEDDRESDGPELEEKRRQQDDIKSMDNAECGINENEQGGEEQDVHHEELAESSGSEYESEELTTDQEEEYIRLIEDSKLVKLFTMISSLNTFLSHFD